MPPQTKSEFEIVYGDGWQGLDYSRPPNMIDKNSLAPGTINCETINGFLSPSPWVAANPYGNTFASPELIIGTFTLQSARGQTASPSDVAVVVVTTVAVYISNGASPSGNNYVPTALTVLHTWAGAELNLGLYMTLGSTISFLQIANVLFFTGMMLQGIFCITINVNTGFPPAFQQATGYVTGAYLTELAGRLCVGQCRFPGGGGTGTSPLPTIAWSGVGIYGQNWDGNAAHDVWNPANSAFFNGNIGGFNQLSDVPDQITGFFSLGRSAVIGHVNGISQQDPNAGYTTSGIQPYIWYHLWNSPQGVGALPGTMVQYGQQIMLVSSDNVYSLSISGGINAVGQKIMPKLFIDRKAASVLYQVFLQNAGLSLQSLGNPNGWYYLSSIITIAGQLHYLVAFNTVTSGAIGQTQPFSYTTLVYDLNLSDGAWMLWDLQRYVQKTLGTQAFNLLTSPIYACTDVPGTAPVQNNTYLLFGAITTITGAGNAAVPTGNLYQLVPFDYDGVTNPINAVITGLYAPISMPVQTVYFRQEVISLGHKVTFRRLRIQADNAPIPSVAPLSQQQQAQVTFTGQLTSNVSPVIPMQVNTAAPPSIPLRTYYGDAQLSDETVQASITSVVSLTTSAWQTLAAMRIANASLIGLDPTATTQ